MLSDETDLNIHRSEKGLAVKEVIAVQYGVNIGMLGYGDEPGLIVMPDLDAKHSV